MSLQSTAADWQFKTKHAQTQDILNNDSGALENFISAESVILAAGPPGKKTDLTGLYPIGLCDSVSIQQNRNIIQLWEVGSKLPYLLPGRTVAQLQLNRVVFNGDSLLGALTSGSGLALPNSDADKPGLPVAGANGDTEGSFYLNLASSFFTGSFGLAILFQDSDQGEDGRGQWVAGFYAENCLIQSHQMNIQGQQYIVMESALVRCTNVAPLDLAPTA
jgi:hypothetical protein